MDVLKTIDEKAFWGREFLTWLWFVSEDTGGEVEVPGVGPVALWIEEHLVLEGPDSQSKENILKSGDVAGSAEAAAALSVGKKVTRARMGLTMDELQWSFTIDAEGLTLRSLKIPPVDVEEEDADDPEALILIRMGLVRKALDAMDGLFSQFARLRLSSEWQAETVPAIGRWIEEKTGG